MNEQTDFERLVADRFAQAGVGLPPDSAIEDTIARAGGNRRLPEWLALIKEPPMRTNNHLAVGSPTVRVVAIMAATLLAAVMLVGATFAGAQLLAANGPIVVAQDGSGTVETISEAVVMAEDGDEVLIRPGTYTEAILIDKDITLMGDGEREDIIIQAPESGPTSPTGIVAALSSVDDPYAMLIVDSDSTISGLTFNGRASALHARGGSPTLKNLYFDGVGRGLGSLDPSDSSIVLTAGTRALFRENLVQGGGNLRVYDRSEPTIEDNTFIDGPTIVGGYGNDAVVRRNTITRPEGNGIVIANPTTALFEDNTLEDVPDYAFAMFPGDGPDEAPFEPVIRGNTVTGGNYGVEAERSVTPMIVGNRFVDLARVAVTAASDVTIADNEFRGNGVGIQVSSGAPTISGNSVTDGEVGIALWSGAAPELTGNTVCDNETNIRLMGNAELPTGEGNEICEDAVAE